jgi:acyl-CoA thioesterase FadM
VPFAGECRIGYRCGPEDADLNGHMNNGRYFKYMDRMRFELSLRTNIWKEARARGLMMVVGTVSIRFRKSVLLWQKFEVTARGLAWNDRWIFMEHKFIVDGEAYAVAIVKIALVSHAGRATPTQYAEIMAAAGPSPPVSELVAAKEALDKLLA